MTFGRSENLVRDVVQGKPELTHVAMQTRRLRSRKPFGGPQIMMDSTDGVSTVFSPSESGAVGTSGKNAQKVGSQNLMGYSDVSSTVFTPFFSFGKGTGHSDTDTEFEGRLSPSPASDAQTESLDGIRETVSRRAVGFVGMSRPGGAPTVAVLGTHRGANCQDLMVVGSGPKFSPPYTTTTTHPPTRCSITPP